MSAMRSLMVFTVLTFSQLVHVMVIRNEEDSLFRTGLLQNRALAATSMALRGASGVLRIGRAAADQQPSTRSRPEQTPSATLKSSRRLLVRAAWQRGRIRGRTVGGRET